MPSKIPPDSQFGFRDLALARFYDANFRMAVTKIGNRSQAAKRDLERYRSLLAVELKQLALTEADAIALFSGIRNGASAKEDFPQLALSAAQWLAVVDACDRVQDGKPLVEELKRVGLL